MPVKTPTSRVKTLIKNEKVADQKEEVKVAQKTVPAQAKETPKAHPVKRETPKAKSKPQAPLNVDSDSESSESEELPKTAIQPKKKIEATKPAKSKPALVKKATPKVSESDEEDQAMHVESSKKRAASQIVNKPAKNQKTESKQYPNQTIEAKNSIYIKGFGDIDPDTIKDLFSTYGEIVDFKVTQDGGRTKSIIIEFSTTEEAQAALNKDGSEIVGKTHTISVTPSKSRTAAQSAEAEKRVVYVANLSYETTTDSLTQQLKDLDIFPSDIRLSFGTDDDKCRGFAHIEFTTSEEAQNAQEKLDNHKQNGRTLRAIISEPKSSRGTSSNIHSGEKKESKILYVGQLNFDSTVESVMKAFSDFGYDVENVRIIKGEDGKSRGFGYVEFDTVEASQEAIKLNGSEIDGRKIKLDFVGDKAQNIGAARGALGGRGGSRGGGIRGQRGSLGGRGGTSGGRGGRGGPRGGFKNGKGDKKITFS